MQAFKQPCVQYCSSCTWGKHGVLCSFASQHVCLVYKLQSYYGRIGCSRARYTVFYAWNCTLPITWLVLHMKESKMEEIARELSNKWILEFIFSFKKMRGNCLQDSRSQYDIVENNSTTFFNFFFQIAPFNKSHSKAFRFSGVYEWCNVFSVLWSRREKFGHVERKTHSFFCLLLFWRECSGNIEYFPRE